MHSIVCCVCVWFGVYCLSFFSANGGKKLNIRSFVVSKAGMAAQRLSSSQLPPPKHIQMHWTALIGLTNTQSIILRIKFKSLFIRFLYLSVSLSISLFLYFVGRFYFLFFLLLLLLVFSFVWFGFRFLFSLPFSSFIFSHPLVLHYFVSSFFLLLNFHFIKRI